MGGAGRRVELHRADFKPAEAGAVSPHGQLIRVLALLPQLLLAKLVVGGLAWSERRVLVVELLDRGLDSDFEA